MILSRCLRCDLHSGHRIFSFVLPMENTRTMYLQRMAHRRPRLCRYAPPHHLTEDTEVTLSNYSDMDFTVALTPSETVYCMNKNGHSK